MEVFENDGKLDADAAQVGCYCLSIAHYHPDITDDEFDAAWESAKAKGIIDGTDTPYRSPGFCEHPRLHAEVSRWSFRVRDALRSAEHAHRGRVAQRRDGLYAFRRDGWSRHGQDARHLRSD